MNLNTRLARLERHSGGKHGCVVFHEPLTPDEQQVIIREKARECGIAESAVTVVQIEWVKPGAINV